MRYTSRSVILGCLLCAAMLLTGFAVQAAMPPAIMELTPSQKKADLEYLTNLVKKEWPFTNNYGDKGLQDVQKLAGQYIARAEKSVDNAAFFAIFWEYIQRLQQIGHAYILSPSDAQVYNTKENIAIYGFNPSGFGMTDYWWGMLLRLLPHQYAHSDARIVYCSGAYILEKDYTPSEGNPKVPRGSEVKKINGASPHQYALSQQNKAPLRYDPDNKRVYLRELLCVNPGKKGKWFLEFATPGGRAMKVEIPSRPGYDWNPAGGGLQCVRLSDDVAYIRIPAFTGDKKSDKMILRNFFAKKNEFDKLIIDIRGNTGGDPAYWMNLLVAPLIKKPVAYSEIAGVRKSLAVRFGSVFDAYKVGGADVLSADYHVKEIATVKSKKFNADWLSFKVTREISPTDIYNFHGSIYLLVDDTCFSAAEDFATMARRTGFAKLVGIRTAGGAAAFVSPVPVMLPNSGILLRLELESTLNPDGAMNEIMGTKPDVVLERAIVPAVLSRENLLRDRWVRWVMADGIGKF